MAAVSEQKTSSQKALLIASGPAMLSKMVRPLKEAGLSVNACENFVDAKGIFTNQALVVLPIKEDDQEGARGFVDWLRRQSMQAPYILGVGRCEPNQRKSLVAKMGLNDLITLPFDESLVQDRLESFRRWSQRVDDKPQSAYPEAVAKPLSPPPTMIEDFAATAPPEAERGESAAAPVAPSELLQTTRVSLFADSPDHAGDEESPESIYCRETPVGVAMFDRELRYVLANPRWLQQFRLQNKDVIGRTQFEVFPKLHPNWKKIYQRCLNGETRRGRETVDAGHGPLEMRWEVRPWRYLAGQIGGVTIAFEEVWKPAEAPLPETPPSSADPDEAPTADQDPDDGMVSAANLEAPAVLYDLAGKVLELSLSAKALGIDKPDAAFVEALTRDVEALPLTELAYHEEATAKVPGRLAWSNTILRDGGGVPTSVLRVGVFLPESVLPLSQEGPDGTRTSDPLLDSFENDELNRHDELIWKANPRGEITFFNRAWLDYRNRSLTEELNGGWLDGLHLSDARATKAIVAEAIREQTPLEHRFRLKAGAGGFHEVDMWVRPFYGPGNELLGFYGACRPAEPGKGISAWPLPTAKAAEHPSSPSQGALEEAKREIAALREALASRGATPIDSGASTALAAGPVMLWASDHAGNLTSINHQWERFRGRSSAQELGSDGWLEGIRSRDERLKLQEQLGRSAREATPFVCRFHWEAGGGKPHLVEMRGTPRLDAQGECVGLSGSLHDISAEHEALTIVRDALSPGKAAAGEAPPLADLCREIRDTLPAWQARKQGPDADMAAFQDIFDHIAAGIVLLDADGRALVTNQKHRELLGFGIDEAGDIENWLREGCDEVGHAESVLKIWHEDIWRRQLTKVVALKSSKGTLRELEIAPQLFLNDNRLLLTISDVTESKRSEEAMRESEIRFRALFRESAMGIALIDAEQKIYDINPALERVLGVPRRQLLCRTFDDCVHPGDLPRKQALLEELLHSPKRSAQIELRIADRAGQEPSEDETWVRLHISLVRDVDQRVLFTAYFVQDITEQKQVQAELLVSQEQNRALLEVIPDLILLVERDGQVIDLMPGEAVPLELPEEDSLGGRIEDIIPAFRDRFHSLLDQAYQFDDVVSFPFEDGRQEAFEARIVACKPDNAVITVHHRSKGAGTAPATAPPPASTGPDRLQALTFQAAPDAVIVTNPDGVILDWNPAAETFFGYARDEALGQLMPALFGVDSIGTLTRHLQQAHGNRWAGELPYQRKNRSEGLAKVMFLPLKSAAGQATGQVAFIREADEAPSKQSQQEERETLRKDVIAEQLPQLHQRLRNNLQIISTLLNLQFKSQTEPDVRHALLTSRNRTQALLLLHEQIKVDHERERVDFTAFAKALGGHLLASYEAQDRINVQIAALPALDLQTASPLALILNELIGNAIRHGFPDPGARGTIQVLAELSEGHGQLTVKNDGRPAPSDGSIPSRMGLQIVKTLASQIGGNLEKIDSTETEFRVYFKTSLSQ